MMVTTDLRVRMKRDMFVVNVAMYVLARHLHIAIYVVAKINTYTAPAVQTDI